MLVGRKILLQTKVVNGLKLKTHDLIFKNRSGKFARNIFGCFHNKMLKILFHFSSENEKKVIFSSLPGKPNKHLSKNNIFFLGNFF